MRRPTKGKQSNKKHCCCQCCSLLNLYSIHYSIHCSIRLQFVFICLIIHLINWFIFITSLYPVKLDFVHRLLYTCFTLVAWINSAPAARVCILLRADRSVCWGSDRHAHQQHNTNSYRYIPGEVISKWYLLNTVSSINCLIVLYCIVSYQFETNFKFKQFQDLTSEWGANSMHPKNGGGKYQRQ